MSALRPEALDIIRRYARGSIALRKHQEENPDWWAAEGIPEEGPLAAATASWRRLSEDTPGQIEALEALEEFAALADERCLIHDDCLDHGALARECARTSPQVNDSQTAKGPER